MKTEYLLITKVTTSQCDYITNELKLFENYNKLEINITLDCTDTDNVLDDLILSTEDVEIFKTCREFLTKRLQFSNINFLQQVKYTKIDEDQEFLNTINDYKDITPFGYLMVTFAKLHEYIYVDYNVVEIMKILKTYKNL